MNSSKSHTFLLHIAYQVYRDTSGVSREQSTAVEKPAKNTLKSFMMKETLLHGNCSKSPIQTNKNTV